MKKMKIFIIALILFSVAALGFFLLQSPQIYNLTGMVLSAQPVYDLTEKFSPSIEVLEKGIYTKSELNDLIDKMRAEELKSDGEVYLVYGNKEEIRIVNYNDLVVGEIDLISSKNSKLLAKQEKYFTRLLEPKTNKVMIILNNIEYEFELKSGESVYLILKEK